MIQSARVQEIVRGDDVVLSHQIMHDVAYDAELSRAPVTIAATDSVNCFYPLEDPTEIDIIGYPAIAIGSYPTSRIQVTIPGVIVATMTVPARGTQSFQSGPARTVRIEITRNFASMNPTKETYYLIKEVDIYNRGFPNSLTDFSAGVNPPAQEINLT